MDQTQKSSQKAWLILFLAWIVTMISTLGSLFFSEIMLFPPCVLCWYQRICMYPLTLIFIVGIFSNDRTVFRYSLPLVAVGLFFALYHNLLYYGIVPEKLAPCTQGVSCTSDYIHWFGFITIQGLSLFAFSLLAALLYFFQKVSR
ncbi:disulfide oxidoreductase [Sulfurospirillum sp. MES]|uniref:disulfide oxidoreductase n=1 Tax=Sulfurospirillum sp. MES TaxID=1565314 RepID=UPI00257B87EB|nr:disulfide oxidoreductase [Sulfurospirillum sp. MES]